MEAKTNPAALDRSYKVERIREATFWSQDPPPRPLISSKFPSDIGQLAWFSLFIRARERGSGNQHVQIHAT